MNQRFDNFEGDQTMDLAQLVASIKETKAPNDAVERLIEKASRQTQLNSDVPISMANSNSASSRTWRWAMVASIAAACLIAANYFSSPRNDLFASMQEAMASTKTIRLVSKVLDSDGEVLRSMTGFVDEAGRIRQEWKSGDVMILDFKRQLAMDLKPSKRTARIYPLYDTGASRNFVEEVTDLLRGRHVESANEVGRTKTTGGVTIVKYKVQLKESVAHVFVDAGTNAPTLIELLLGNGSRVEVNEFVFDEPLSERLFAIEAPSDFAVTRVDRVELIDDIKDEGLVFTPGVGLGPVKFGFSKVQVLESFGQPDEMFQDDAQVFQGEKGWVTIKKDVLMYGSRGFQIQILPESGVKTISCIDQAYNNVGTGRPFAGNMAGIRFGDSLVEVEKVLGGFGASPPSVKVFPTITLMAA